MSDFYSRQMEFTENSESISDVQNDSLLTNFISDYLQKNQKDWVDDSLVTFIRAKWDSQNVIKYITYSLNNNPDNLSNDDLIQLAYLKTRLEERELNSLQDSVEKNRNIDFEIVWWTIEVKIIKVKFKWWIRTKTRNETYDIVNEKIVDLWDNRYKILLKRENSSRTYKFEIKYTWWHWVTVYDQYWKYIWRQVIETKQKTIIKWNRNRKEIYQTPGSFTIDTKKLKIKLNIMFNQ